MALECGPGVFQPKRGGLNKKVVLMNKDKIMQVGTPRELYNEPASLFVADFIGKSNFLPCVPGDKNGSGLGLEILNKKLHIPGPGKAFDNGQGSTAATAVIRPEGIKVLESGKGHFEMEYEVQLGPKLLRVEAACPQEHIQYKVNDNVGIALDLKSIRIIREQTGEKE